MDVNGSGPSFTLQDINSIDNVFDAFQLAEDYDIDIGSLDSLDEIKQRLKCHLRMKDGSPKEKMVAKICKLGEKDCSKRQQLADMILQVRDTFPAQGIGIKTVGQNLMEDLLLKDGTTDNIRKDCDVRMKSLKAKESVILVAGESSAGKSSVLNLLLGEQILPSHMLPCTSCITVIRYNHYRCARILYKNGKMTKIDSLDKEGLQELQSRAYFSKKTDEEGEKEIYDQRREEHDIAEIQVFLPLELLKSGLVLVDTPGVGENEFLENYLMDYIYSHQILGFMYIVMTDNALGVAEDRLVNLMSLIVKSKRNSTDIVKFDPRAALFVCNRWDLVPVESRVTVRQTTLRQLGKCWPDFDDSQAVFFSTFKAEQETAVNPGYITDEYQTVLQGLYSLTKVSLDKRITASYKWLGGVLLRCLHYLKTMARQTDMSARERQVKTEGINKKLKLLRDKSVTVVDRLRQNVEDAIQDICARLRKSGDMKSSNEHSRTSLFRQLNCANYLVLKIRKYLQTPPAKLKLTKGWGKKEGELPDVEHSLGTWDWVKRRIETAFQDRLTNLLEEWDKDEQSIHSLEKQMFRDAKLQLCDLESDLNELEDQVREESILRTSICSNLSGSFDEFKTDDIPDDDIPEKMLHRILNFVTKKTKKRQSNQKLEAFRENPSLVAEQRSEKLLEQMVKGKDSSLEMFVREMMFQLINFIKILESKIPSIVRSNQTLLETIEKEVVEQSKRRNEYLDTMERIELIRSNLIQYGEGHFYANDFAVEDIELDAPPPPSGRSILARKSSVDQAMMLPRGVIKNDSISFPQGLWHILYQGNICKEESKGQFISVRIYNRDLVKENSVQEISKLRCLLHKDVCVAEFLGVYRQKDPPTPAYIYNGRLMSLKQYMKMTVEADDLKLLVEVLTGLQYIHSKSLVHMDLTKDTVTVDENGNVKLTGPCLPRKIADPGNQMMLDFVYISPEVLKGYVYITKADMYAFALLALEIRNFEYKAFEEQRVIPITDFVDLDHLALLEPHVMASSFQHSIQRKLLKCLDRNLTVRPSALEMSNDIQATIKASNVVRRTATPRHIWKTFSGKKR